MADNVSITPGVGSTISTDDIGGIQFQRVKLTLGADGVNDGDVSSANKLPVDATVSGTVTVDGSASTQPVSGTVTVTGVATEATLAAQTCDTNDVTITTMPAVDLSTDGLSIYRNIDLGATGVSVKGSAGEVHGYALTNRSADTEVFIKLYDTASAPTVGTDTPVFTFSVPFDTPGHVPFPNGVTFSSGIGIAATTGIADSDTGAPAANSCVVNLFYK